MKLTYRNGECVYVNPAQVIAVEPHPLYQTPPGGQRVEKVGDGAKVYFALIGNYGTDAGTTEVEPFYAIVTESAKAVAGLFVDPLVG